MSHGPNLFNHFLNLGILFVSSLKEQKSEKQKIGVERTKN